MIINNMPGGVNPAGSATQPVYINSNGEAIATTYALNKTVPSDAKFTDTTYSNATTTVAGLMSASDKSKLDGIAAGAKTGTVTSVSVAINGSTKGTVTTSGTIDLGSIAGLPSVTTSDNGKYLKVVNGAWAAASMATSAIITLVYNVPKFSSMSHNYFYIKIGDSYFYMDTEGTVTQNVGVAYTTEMIFGQKIATIDSSFTWDLYWQGTKQGTYVLEYSSSVSFHNFYSTAPCAEQMNITVHWVNSSSTKTIHITY